VRAVTGAPPGAPAAGGPADSSVGTCAQCRLAACLAAARVWTDTLLRTGAKIVAVRAAFLRLGVDDVVIGRVYRGLEAIAGTETEPRGVRNNSFVGSRGARPAPAAVVLHSGVHVIRTTHVRRNPI